MTMRPSRLRIPAVIPFVILVALLFPAALSAQFSIVPATLPAGITGNSYSQVLTMTGSPPPTPPITWSIITGSLPPGLNLDTAGGIISGSPTAAGTFNFTVQAVDSLGATTSRGYSLLIVNPLVITTVTLPSGNVGVPYNFTIATSGGAPPITITLEGGTLPPGITLAPSGLLSGTPTSTGVFSFSVLAIDGIGQNAGANLTISISAGPLTITTTSLPSGSVGAFYAATLAATGGIPAYAWTLIGGALPGGLTLSTAGDITGTPTAAGVFNFTVRVNDQQGNNTTRPLSISVTPRVSITTASPLPNGKVGLPYSNSITAINGTPGYFFQVLTGILPPGLSLSNSGLLSGMPTAPGTFSFVVQVLDSNELSDTKTFNLTIIPPTPMTVSPSTLPSGQLGRPYLVGFTVSGNVGTPVFSLLFGELPPGLSLSSGGSIGGTPTTVGSYKFTLGVNAGGEQLQQGYSIDINADTLTLSPTTLSDGLVGSPYNVPFSATGGKPPYTFTVTSGSLPTGLSLSSTGLLGGVPTTAGDYSFTVRVNDSSDLTFSREYRLRIAGPPSVTAGALSDATQGESYTAAIPVTGGRSPFVYELTEGNLPPGLSLGTDGRITGTPTTAGDYPFTVRVTDANQLQASGQLSIRVFATLRITTESLPAGLPGVNYTPSVQAEGGQTPYVFDITSGTLPQGIQLQSNGTFSGSTTQTGSFPIVVRVRDARSRSASRDLTVVIEAGVVITTGGTLQQGTVGTAYSAQISAEGGRPPYQWSATNALPPGLNLDAATGLLSGTPTTAGNFNFTLRVQDGASLFDTQAFTLAIILPPLPPPTLSGLPSSAGASEQPTFNIRIASAYPALINGVTTLTFAPDRGGDDPAVMFSNGSRTLNFTIPAGTTNAVFPGGQAAVQTGTVAGLITLTTRYSSGGTDLTPSPVPTSTMRVNEAPPVITRLELNRTTGGFELIVTGYSTPRDVASARIQFAASGTGELQTTELTVDVAAIFTAYFGSATSQAFGSQFRLVLPFNVTNDIAAIRSATVTLTNSAGTSQAATVNF